MRGTHKTPSQNLMKNKSEEMSVLFKELYGVLISEKYAKMTDQEMYEFAEKVLFHYKSNHDVK